MNENLKEKAAQAITYLERMADGNLPISDIPKLDDSVLNSAEVVRSLYFIRDVVKTLVDENNRKSPNQKKGKQQFSVECLENFSYEADKTIMSFVEQLKRLAGNPDVKGISVKKITDWLKAGGYLQDKVDPINKEKYTGITEKGIEAGLYTEVRNTRLGQEYTVIVYSEKAQLWIVDNLKMVL